MSRRRWRSGAAVIAAGAAVAQGAVGVPTATAGIGGGGAVPLGDAVQCQTWIEQDTPTSFYPMQRSRVGFSCSQIALGVRVRGVILGGGLGTVYTQSFGADKVGRVLYTDWSWPFNTRITNYADDPLRVSVEFAPPGPDARVGLMSLSYD